MAAQEMGASAVELGYPSIAYNPSGDTTADEIRAAAPEPTLRPSDRRGLFDVPTFAAALLDTIRHDQKIALSSESN